MVKRIKIDECIKKWNENNPNKKQKSRKALSEEIECSFSLINNLQAGRVGKSIQNLTVIAEVLEVKIDELIEK